MSAVELRITNPLNNTIFNQGETEVELTLEGEVVEPIPEELIGTQLYYRWYSNLFAARQDRYSLNEEALSHPLQPYQATLPLRVGTHSITLAASDRSNELEAANESEHGGVTGGTAGNGKCLLHVFFAHIISPVPNSTPATLRQSNSILEAEAPREWSREITSSETTSSEIAYKLNPDYHQINQIRYRWRFQPIDEPPNRIAVDLVPSLGLDELDRDRFERNIPEAQSEEDFRLFTTGELTLANPNREMPLVRYTGGLPNVLVPGSNYTLTLRVEGIDDPSTFHTSNPITVQII